jgi:hypothetical protein
LAFKLGITAVALVIILIFVVPRPTPFQSAVLWVMLSLGTGGVATVFPGLLTVSIANGVVSISASGALAVYIMTHLFRPNRPTGSQKQRRRQPQQ